MEPLAALGLASNIVQIADFAGRMIARSKEIYNSTEGTLSIHVYLEDAAKNLQELSRDLVEETSDPGARRPGAMNVQSERERRDARLLWEIREKKAKKKEEEEDEQRARDAARREGHPAPGKIVGGQAKTKEEKRWRKKRRDEAKKVEEEKRSRANEEQKRLDEDAQQLRTAEKQLLALSMDTKRITNKIINACQKLKSDHKSSRFQSVRQAFRSVWSESQIKSLETDLENIRRQTDTALLFSVR
jgi:hypothetical protein